MNKAAGNSLCAVLCVDINFQLLWVNTKEHDGLIIWWEFSFTRNCQTDFQSGYIILHSHQCESSCCSTSPSAFGVVNVLDFDHSNRHVAVFHFNLQFPSVMWCRTSFHMLTSHLYIYSALDTFEVSINKPSFLIRFWGFPLRLSIRHFTIIAVTVIIVHCCYLSLQYSQTWEYLISSQI